MFETALVGLTVRVLKMQTLKYSQKPFFFMTKYTWSLTALFLTDLLKVIPPQDFLNLIKSNKVRLSYSKQSNRVSLHENRSDERGNTALSRSLLLKPLTGKGQQKTMRSGRR